MNRRKFIYNTALLAGAGLLFQKQALAELFRTAAPGIRMLRNDVGIFTEKGGTIGFLLSDAGIVVIDAQFPDSSKNFIAEAKKMKDKPFSYLLNTHHHGDHTSGNISFKGMVGHVIAHENSLVNQKATAEKQNLLDKTLLPDRTFGRKIKLKAGREKIRGYYFGAAHTNGDALWHFDRANIVHMGDLMFNKRHPFVDRAAGANMSNWITVLDKAVREFERDTIYIFGHSLTPGEETGTAEDLKKFGGYLAAVLQFAEKEFKAGKSKEEFIKNTSIPGVTEWSGDGIQRPLQAAYEEVSTK
jgi:cyclase